MNQGQTDTYEYSYDLTGRLVSVLKNSSPLSSYSYDLNDNRVAATVNGENFAGAYDAQDRIVSYGPYSYIFSGHAPGVVEI